MKIRFNYPHATGKEVEMIAQAISSGHLSGNGQFTKRCQQWLEATVGCPKALLTHSCTAALEMAAILANVGPGDEVIMPSYTFVSTANAFVLRGAVPVFVDIRPDTLNINELLIEEAITARTKAIVAVHYAGVGCEMDAIMDIAERHSLLVIEDAAQAIMAEYKGRPLGGIGHLAALSFHETKNLISGEGGALLINDRRFETRAEIIWEKGTNRSQFFRGEIDKYTWVDVGSSFLPSDIIGAFLWSQLSESRQIANRRLEVWEAYHDGLRDLRESKFISGPFVPPHCTHNAHMYYVLARTPAEQQAILERLRAAGVGAVFHYVPLHNSPAGKRFGRTHGSLMVTDDVSARLIRLPLWPDIRHSDIASVCAALSVAAKDVYHRRNEHSRPE